MTNENTPAVQKCAALARLQVEPEQVERLAEDFDRILDAFRGLTELDVSGVKPMTGALDLQDIVRADEPRPSLERERLLAPAPKVEDGFFAVPKTVDGDA